MKSWLSTPLFRPAMICLSFVLLCFSLSIASDEENKTIHIRNVQGSVESTMEAIALNDAPIEPTDFLHAGIGDNITFKVTIRNSLPISHFNVESQVNWGAGFSFIGKLSCNKIECRYEERDDKIYAVIPELLPDSPEETFYYTFDLFVKGSENLFVKLYSDELYTCDKLKTYYTAVDLKTPDIVYSVSYSDEREITVNIENKGTGNAVGFTLETNFKGYSLAVGDVSEGFTYDSSTGTFVCNDPIEPGQSTTLTFNKPITGTPDPNTFRATYASDCGIHFISSQIAGPEPASHDTNQPLLIRVTPECFMVSPPDKTLEWSIYVINRGEETVRNVKLKNTLGRNLRYEYSSVDDEATFPALTDETSLSGATSALWDLGNIKPAGVRKITITACPPDEPEELDGYFNSIVVQHGDKNEYIEYEEIVASPCFFLPGECISGDVFQQCGKLHGYFAFTQMYKSNLFRAADNPKSSWATFLTPGVWVAVPGSCERIIEIVTTSATPGGLAVSPFYPKTQRKYQTYFLYSPQFEFYHNHSDKTMTSHRVDAYFRYNTQNRFSFRLLDQYKQFHDSISSRVYTINDRYKSNLLNAIATYDPTDKFRLRLDYSNFYLDYDSEANSLRADRMDNSWAAYAYFNITSKMSIFANYEFTDINYDTNDLDSQEKRLFGGIRWDVSHKTNGQVKGGYGEKNFDPPGITDTSTWMAEIQVDHVLTPRTRVIFNAYRRYDEIMNQRLDRDDLPDIFTKYILTQFFGLSLNYKLLSRLNLNLDGTLFFDEYKDEKRLADRKERRDTEFAISPAINFDFRKWLTADLAYIYTKRDSNYPQYNLEDHTVFFRASLYY